jgi:hypothetical protein
MWCSNRRAGPGRRVVAWAEARGGDHVDGFAGDLAAAGVLPPAGDLEIMVQPRGEDASAVNTGWDPMTVAIRACPSSRR